MERSLDISNVFILKINTFLFFFFIKLQCKFETPLSFCKKL